MACKIIEDYAKEIAYKRDVENVKNMFESKGSLELAIATFKNLSEATIRKIYEEVIDEKKRWRCIFRLYKRREKNSKNLISEYKVYSKGEDRALITDGNIYRIYSNESEKKVAYYDEDYKYFKLYKEVS